jgi:hypothetical protein
MIKHQEGKIKEARLRNCTYLKRVSADLDGPANTNLLFVLCVRKGLIILLNVRYHHGTFMNTFKYENPHQIKILFFFQKKACNLIEKELIDYGPPTFFATNSG